MRRRSALLALVFGLGCGHGATPTGPGSGQAGNADSQTQADAPLAPLPGQVTLEGAQAQTLVAALMQAGLADGADGALSVHCSDGDALTDFARGCVFDTGLEGQDPVALPGGSSATDPLIGLLDDLGADLGPAQGADGVVWEVSNVACAGASAATCTLTIDDDTDDGDPDLAPRTLAPAIAQTDTAAIDAYLWTMVVAYENDPSLADASDATDHCRPSKQGTLWKCHLDYVATSHDDPTASATASDGASDSDPWNGTLDVRFAVMDGVLVTLTRAEFGGNF
jgi:hypothetical protein